MAQITVNYPVPGDPNSTEDQKVLTALQTLVNTINALDNDNIASAAGINGSKLLDASIAAAKLASDAVETAKIKDANVTTAKLENDAVTADKLRDSTNTDANRAVTTNHIRDGAITDAKISLTDSDATITSGTNWTSVLLARRYPGGLVSLSRDGGVAIHTRVNSGGSSISISYGTVLATIPAGWRPRSTLQIPAVISNTGASPAASLGRVQISSSSGQITYQGDSITLAAGAILTIDYNASYPRAT